MATAEWVGSEADALEALHAAAVRCQHLPAVRIAETLLAALAPRLHRTLAEFLAWAGSSPHEPP